MEIYRRHFTLSMSSANRNRTIRPIQIILQRRQVLNNELIKIIRINIVSKRTNDPLLSYEKIETVN